MALALTLTRLPEPLQVVLNPDQFRAVSLRVYRLLDIVEDLLGLIEVKLELA
jgi:hypothetical protein